MSQNEEKRQHNGNLKNWVAGIALALPPAALLGALLAAVLPGPWGYAVVYSAVLYPPCLWVGLHLGPTLIARYDGDLLAPPAGAEPGLRQATPQGAAEQRVWAALQSWCLAGMGDGRVPFWQPSRLPDMAERLGVAVLVGGDGEGAARLVAAFARQLDRDDELAALSADSRLKGLRLKLAVKWHELWWWRARHPRQPWDCGYLMDGAGEMVRLARFRPRRPTLIIANALRGDALAQVLRVLGAAKAHYRHPVRVLVMNVDGQCWPAGTQDLGRVTVIEWG